MAAKGNCPECGRMSNLDGNGKVRMHPAARSKVKQDRLLAGPCAGVGKNPEGAR